MEPKPSELLPGMRESGTLCRRTKPEVSSYEVAGATAIGRKIGFTNRTCLDLRTRPRQTWMTALLSCVAWVALGFEIVQSIYPGWRFSAADTVAANGVHGALLIGPRHPVLPRRTEWQRTLSAFEIDLDCGGRRVDRGQGENVLGGPLSPLRHLVGLLASDPVNPPLTAGEIVSTGTLTKAMPVAPGETWAAIPTAIALDAIQLRFS
jgi:2-keto-4-pentenoate hydratase